MQVESTLGGIATSTDETSWPTQAPFVLDEIMGLGPPQPGSDLPAVITQLTATIDTLKKILMDVACGMEESHLILDCIFLSTEPYMHHTGITLRDGIMLVKDSAACSDDIEEMRHRFARASRVHSVIQEAYRAKLHGGAGPGQEQIIAQIVQVLNP